MESMELPPRGRIDWGMKPNHSWEMKTEALSGQVVGQLSGIELLNYLQHRLTTEEISYVARVCGETAALSQTVLEVNSSLFLRFSDSIDGNGRYNHSRRLITLSVSNRLNPLISAYREVQLLGESRLPKLELRESHLRRTVAHECSHQDQCFRYPAVAQRSRNAAVFKEKPEESDAYLADRGERVADLFSYGLLRKLACMGIINRLAAEEAISQAIKNRERLRTLKLARP